MKYGVVFPQTEIGADPSGVRDYVQAVEEIGFDHVLIYDHVLGADVTNRPDWRGPYTAQTMFHEPFVLYGYLAAMTKRVELVCGVIVLPQRQTSLVAKQATEVDVLSGGRMRLGVGIGWNEVEYQALNENFHNRGARFEEQIAVLRELFTKPVVTFNGRYHHIEAAGLNPLPVQRPIPIWIGASEERALARIGRLADGWFPQRPPAGGWQIAFDIVAENARKVGRDPSSIQMEARMNISGSPDDWRKAVEEWRARGATHVSLNTMGAGLASPTEHIAAIRRWWEATR